MIVIISSNKEFGGSKKPVYPQEKTESIKLMYSKFVLKIDLKILLKTHKNVLGTRFLGSQLSSGGYAAD